MKTYTVLFHDSSDPVVHVGRLVLLEGWVMFTTKGETVYYPARDIFRIKRTA